MGLRILLVIWKSITIAIRTSYGQYLILLYFSKNNIILPIHIEDIEEFNKKNKLKKKKKKQPRLRRSMMLLLYYYYY